MKWSGWIVGSLFLFAAVAAIGSEPSAPPRLLRTQVVPVRLVAVNQEAPPNATPAPAAAPAPAAGIEPHAPVHYRQASWDVWSGYSGYVYSPGACDYRPPCIDGLWDGYVQRPHRCNPPHVHSRGCGHCGSCGHFGHGHCGGGCLSCSSAPTCAAAPSCAVAPSCGCDGHMSFLKRKHAWHFGGKLWSCASCGSIAPSCSAPTCAAPSCGCDGITNGKGLYDIPTPAADGPPQPMPEAGNPAPKVEASAPVPEEAFRGNRLRGYRVPDSSLR